MGRRGKTSLNMASPKLKSRKRKVNGEPLDSYYITVMDLELDHKDYRLKLVEKMMICLRNRCITQNKF